MSPGQELEQKKRELKFGVLRFQEHIELLDLGKEDCIYLSISCFVVVCLLHRVFLSITSKVFFFSFSKMDILMWMFLPQIQSLTLFVLTRECRIYLENTWSSLFKKSL